MGDAAGIGPEIAVRALLNESIYRICRPLLIGDSSVIRATLEGMRMQVRLHPLADVDDASFLPGQIDLLDLDNIEFGKLNKARVCPMAGRAAYEYIVKAIDLALAGKVAAVVTCPIHKESLNQAGYHYPGHTQIFAECTGSKDYAMMLVTGKLRVVLVTIHVSLREAIEQIDEKRILRTIRLAHEAGLLMGISHPRIGVPGLNPHAGEGGMFGREEIEIIVPAVVKARTMGYNAQGPFPADTIFYRALKGQFDFLIPMYHDQGLIPIKLIGFGRGVNVTLGLPIIRTSVDHGTAFGKAWEFRADEGSLLEAIRVAAKMAKMHSIVLPTSASETGDA